MKRICIALVGLMCVAVSAAPKSVGADDEGGKNITRMEMGPRKWALLIGVNNYTKVSKLTYCCADIQGLAKHLVEAGFPGDHVFLIEDNAADMKYKPFKNNIEQQLDLVASLTRPDDMILVAFSGHGVQIKKGQDDKEGISYLCPADADLEKPGNTLVPLDRVYKTLESCRARQKLLLVDACRNDPSPSGGKGLDDTGAAAKEFAQALSKEPPGGIVLLSSCKAGQKSWEDEKFGHGVFMHFVMKGLAGEAADASGSVSLFKLYEYAADKTEIHVATTKSRAQTPEIFGRHSGKWELAKLQRRPTPGPHPEEHPTAAVPVQTPAPNPMAAILIGQADRYFAAGEFDSAIHSYTNSINLDPKNASLYLKRGASYRAKGDIKMAVADYQVGGRAISLTVQVPTSPLKNGDNVTATVTEGQTLSITQVNKYENTDWLWVEAVDGNTAASGWIMMDAVVKKAAPAPTADASATPAATAGNGTSYNYSSGSDYDSMTPVEKKAARDVQRAQDNAERHPNNLGLQRAAENKERAYERRFGGR